MYSKASSKKNVNMQLAIGYTMLVAGIVLLLHAVGIF